LKRNTLSATFLLFALGLRLGAAPVLTLRPGNDPFPPSPAEIRGNGNVVGIGFVINNTCVTCMDWLFLTGVSLLGNPNPASNIGTWTDLVGVNQYVIAPKSTFIQSYNNSISPFALGLAHFSFDASAFAAAGPLDTVRLSYDSYDDDPVNGSPVNAIYGLTIDVPLQFTVLAPQSPPVAPIPEPATLLLTPSALAALVLYRRRQSRR
jgi:hypothetical protein